MIIWNGCASSTSSMEFTTAMTKARSERNLSAAEEWGLKALELPIHATDAEVRLYDNLFTVEKPDEIDDYTSALNPDSAYTVKTCKIESRISTAAPETRYQFERIGYFCVDNKDSNPNALVFNRIVGLRDTWSKIERKSNT